MCCAKCKHHGQVMPLFQHNLHVLVLHPHSDRCELEWPGKRNTLQPSCLWEPTQRHWSLTANAVQSLGPTGVLALGHAAILGFSKSSAFTLASNIMCKSYSVKKQTKTQQFFHTTKKAGEQGFSAHHKNPRAESAVHTTKHLCHK